MNAQIDFITLIALIVAAVAILKLKSVLGHRNDEDDARVERLKTRERDGSKPASANATGEVISLPRRTPLPDAQVAQPAEAAVDDTQTRIKGYPALDPSITQGLLEIAHYDGKLDPEQFVAGARKAYEMVVSAFADGNKKQLKDLLSRDVYEGFVAAITERETRGEKVDQQFVGINKADIIEAEVKNGMASISVRFLSQLITATHDKGGAVIAGDPQRIKDVTDIWTFSRDVASRKALDNPNWKLVATQAPN
jgi:predicted lipid-binding transport protein (Tim44 family)